jgi:hypothetical protein
MKVLPLPRVPLAPFIIGLFATAVGGSHASGAQLQTGPSEIVVTTAADELDPVGAPAGGISLREAMRDVADGGRITFDPAIFNAEPADVITLTLGTLELAGRQLTIDASDIPGGVTVSGNDMFRIFRFFPDATATVNGLTLTAGRAGQGGGMLAAGTVTLNRCRIVNNTATGQGGGFQNNSEGTPASLVLNECTIAGNAAPFGAGGLNVSEGTGYVSTLVLTRCTVAGNHATTDGGGLENYASAGQAALTIDQCTIAQNTAASVGGGMINFSNGGAATAQLRQSTVSGNSANIGKGIRNNSIATSFTLFNSLVAANPAPGQADFFGLATSHGGNLIGNGTNLAMSPAAGDQIGTAGAPIHPLLAPLAGYGGPTQTMALLPGSPARNAANASAVTADQRGCAIVGTHDIGAYEAGTLVNFAAWSWETHGLGLDWNLDGDFDGAIAGLEYATRRNPFASDALLAPALDGPPGGRTFTFRYRASARDLRYIVQRSADLADAGAWTEVYRYDGRTGLITETGVTGDESLISETITISDPAPGARLFWRLRVEQVP